MTAMEMILQARTIRERLIRPPNAVKDTPIDLRRHRDSPPIVSALPRPSNPVLWVSPKSDDSFHMEAIPHFFDVSFPWATAWNENPVDKSDILVVKAIIRAVAARFNLNPWDMKGPSRRRRYSYPRQIATYLAHNHTLRSSGQLGLDFGRDHSTILHSLKRIEEKLESGDGATIAHIQQLEDLLFADHTGRTSLASRG